MKKLLKLALYVGIVSAALLLGSCGDNATEASDNITPENPLVGKYFRRLYYSTDTVMGFHVKYTIVPNDTIQSPYIKYQVIDMKIVAFENNTSGNDLDQGMAYKLVYRVKYPHSDTISTEFQYMQRHRIVRYELDSRHER